MYGVKIGVDTKFGRDYVYSTPLGQLKCNGNVCFSLEPHSRVSHCTIHS